MWYKKLFSSLCFLGLLTSCAVQSPSTGLTKYQQAVARYEAKSYYKAAQLLEEALPQLRGKKEEASARFYQAYCSFHQKEYVKSSDRFKYFYETFLQDPRLEEALYMQAHTLYLQSPDVKLDQAFTQKATYIFRTYLQHYPKGAYAEKAKAQLEVLKNKLALKDFSSAQLYYRLAHYQAAVVALENFQQDFPHSSHNEKAAYLKAEAQYHCFRAAQENKAKEQLSKAIKYCQEFLDNYPNSPYARTVGEIYNKLSRHSWLQTL
ncbi:MAG: outer membrane protein assembly factor BamD [Bacteroidota bacterium]